MKTQSGYNETNHFSHLFKLWCLLSTMELKRNWLSAKHALQRTLGSALLNGRMSPDPFLARSPVNLCELLHVCHFFPASRYSIGCRCHASCMTVVCQSLPNFHKIRQVSCKLSTWNALSSHSGKQWEIEYSAGGLREPNFKAGHEPIC